MKFHPRVIRGKFTFVYLLSKMDEQRGDSEKQLVKRDSTPGEQMLVSLRGMSSLAISKDVLQYIPTPGPGDPIGLGIKGKRPDLPPDPDMYDIEEDKKSGVRSLSIAKDREDSEWDIIQIRKFLYQRLTTLGGTYINAQDLLAIHMHARTKIYIIQSHKSEHMKIYDRKMLHENFAFLEARIQPEIIFQQQEIGVFSPPRFGAEHDIAYRPKGSADKFMTSNDIMREMCGKEPEQKLLERADTMVFIATPGNWEAFINAQDAVRIASRRKWAEFLSKPENVEFAALM